MAEVRVSRSSRPRWPREAVTFKGRLVKDGDDAFLRGRIGGGLACTCARCLEPARLPLDLTMNVTFVARTGDDADADADDDDDDENVATYDGDEIDVGAQIATRSCWRWPINPLCARAAPGCARSAAATATFSL